MSSNLENPLELIQKTYHNHGTGKSNNLENSSQTRPSIAKVSIHQPSRKNSVHDIHELNKDALNKILQDIIENLSRLRILLETMNSVQTIREEFFKLKDHLFKKIQEFIHKLANESGKRGSIVVKGNTTNLMTNYPQYLVYSIEHFRTELIKSQYLFNSLKLSSSIGTATLDSIIVKSSFHPNNELIPSNDEEKHIFDDINQLTNDISNLEEHIYLLNQRYYSQIPDWNPLDALGKSMSNGGTLSNNDQSYLNRLRLNEKFSRRTSSMASEENSSLCYYFYRKCQIICCFCQTNYI